MKCLSTPLTNSRHVQVTRKPAVQWQPARKVAVRRPGASAVVRVTEVNEAEFDTVVLKANGAVLVDFWAPWCGPCKLVAPMMNWVEQEYAGAVKVVKVCTDPNPGLVAKYKVYGLPTLKLFKDGVEVNGSHWEGALTKKKLAEYLEKHGISKVTVNA